MTLKHGAAYVQGLALGTVMGIISTNYFSVPGVLIGAFIMFFIAYLMEKKAERGDNE